MNYACIFKLSDNIWRVDEFTLCLFKQSDAPDCGINAQNGLVHQLIQTGRKTILTQEEISLNVSPLVELKQGEKQWMVNGLILRDRSKK